MEPLLASIEATSIAQYLKSARWAYAAVNGLHVFGIALLVGAILPLDLRLLGFWRGVDRSDLVRVLVPVAATGLLLAMSMGALLFATRAGEYANISFLQAKLALVATGLIAALLLHTRHGFTLAGADDRTLRVHAIISMFCWTGALACGRLIAFA